MKQNWNIFEARIKLMKHRKLLETNLLFLKVTTLGQVAQSGSNSNWASGAEWVNFLLEK